uniref:NADH-ubiquinone oxidoreductase chain 2 n=1 Tax=Acropyga smithii TaxID=602228 RepID=A0A6G5NIC5_9HYME|nr:NADH dehydrogenase subunit 2 [Acropyga smithii]QBG38703.1 NADH dehydrogenase subunit 2 [Acropyga smithii]
MLINNLFQKFFILTNLITFSMSSLFFQDFLIIWFFMEINNLMFICYMSLQLMNKKSIFLFYIIQIVSSLLMILPFIFNNFFMSINMNFFLMNLYLSLMIKLGIPPLHSWMPNISNFMNWNIMLIFLTIQKIIPLYVLSLIEIKYFIFNYLVISSLLISTYKMLNLLNIKMLMTYSSINQTSWMLFLIYMKNLLWMMYLFLYTLILFTVFFFISFFKFNSNFYLNTNLATNFNIMFLMLMLNLASIPPLSFFLFKWLNIFISIFNMNFHMIFLLMMISSFILIYIYINLMILTLFFYSIKFKFFYFPITLLNKNYLFLLLNFINLFLSFIIILL